METILKIVQTVNAYLSDYILLFLLIGCGLYFTVRTKFVQVRCFGEGMKKVFGSFSMNGGKEKGGLSSFQALATAISAQVGTGNIVGACGAILIGGPGAIFWMWIIAFFGMATIYAEAILAQKTRVVSEDGSVHGGPVYYIKKAYKGRLGKFLAGFFAVSTTLALGFMGAMVQSNSISETMGNALNISGWIIGLVLVVISAFIFIGGIQRIASVTEKIVPIMAGLYLVLGFIMLGFNVKYIPLTLGLIFKHAFLPNAVIGGSIGWALKTAISQGAKRGLFSNEAGMGSTPHAHAMANVKEPHEQGIVAMIGVFIDTFVVLTMTALVVISTFYGRLGGNLEGVTKTNMLQKAFSTLFGTTSGNILVALCLFFFAFSTIISWNFFGKVNFTYLFGKKSSIVYTVIAIGFIFLGSLFPNDLVWELTDMFNNLMVIPNVLALVPLASIVILSARKSKTEKTEDEAKSSEESVSEEA